jgi:hypothetical protein
MRRPIFKGLAVAAASRGGLPPTGPSGKFKKGQRRAARRRQARATLEDTVIGARRRLHGRGLAFWKEGQLKVGTPDADHRIGRAQAHLLRARLSDRAGHRPQAALDQAGGGLRLRPLGGRRIRGVLLNLQARVGPNPHPRVIDHANLDLAGRAGGDDVAHVHGVALDGGAFLSGGLDDARRADHHLNRTGGSPCPRRQGQQQTHPAKPHSASHPVGSAEDQT